MKTKTIHSPYYYLNSRHLTLSDFGLKINGKISKEKRFKDDINGNMLLNFTESTYNYAIMTLSKYSCNYSNHKYTQPQLFTIFALKIYLKTTYRGVTEFLESSDKISKFLHLIKIPHFTTIQKFYSKLSDQCIKDLNKYILLQHPNKSEILAMDGTGHTSDRGDLYYIDIRGKERKSYTKNHILIDVDTRMILHYNAVTGPKHDTKFAIPAIRSISKYKPHYILADKAYDSEKIRQCINEEIGAFDQIPLKKGAKTGKYRLRSTTTFWKTTYNRRMNVESVIYVIKQKFNGKNFSRSDKLRNKETKMKDVLYNIYRLIQIS